MSKPRSYHADWDTYVENWEFYSTLEPNNRNVADLVCPGDEWGTKKEWNRITNKYLKPYLPKNSTGIAVEIGQGTGKYTFRVVDAVSKIVCFDVSKKFIEIAGSKLKDHIEQRTVFLEFLDLHNCYEIRDRLKKHDLIGKVDLFYSIDSMQHVEFHTLFAYFINAAICLKSGGHMVITVANCTSDDGFERLLKEIPWCYGGHRPSHQFYFLSKDIIWYSLERLGFEVVKHEEDRDILVVAKKTKKTEEKIRETQAVYAKLVNAVAKVDTQTKKEDMDLKDLVSHLTIRLKAAEADRKARLKVIEHQEKEFFERLKKSEDDRAARLEAIKKLGIKLDAAEAAQKARLEVIERQEKEFSEKLQKSEDDRTERLKVIEDLGIKLDAAKADRKARLEVIEHQEKEFSEKLKKSEDDRAARLEAIKDLGIKLDAAMDDRKARLEVIEHQEKEFSEKLQKIEDDRAERLKVIEDLGIKLDTAKADRKARLEVIEHQEKEFSERLKKSEDDRAARLEAIKDLGIKLDAATDDRKARLEVIECQEKEFSENLQKIEDDRAERLKVIEDLGIKLDAAEADRKARLEVIEQQAKEFSEKMQEIEADRAARFEVIKDVCNKLEFYESECDRLHGEIKRLSTLKGFLKDFVRRKLSRWYKTKRE